MARYGIPLYAPAQTCKCLVTITHPDGKVEFKTWRSRRGARAIHRAVKAAYPDAKLQFGRSFWVTD